MLSDDIFSEFHNLITNCVENKCSPKQYCLFYNEFFNEKFGFALKTETNDQHAFQNNDLIEGMDKNIITEDFQMDGAAAASSSIDEDQKSKIYKILSDCFLKTLSSPDLKPAYFITIVEYLIQICFIDYNTCFVQNITQSIHQLCPENDTIVILFLTKSTEFFKNLTDQLIINDFLKKDVPHTILPNLVSNLESMKSKQVLVSLGKFFFSVIHKCEIPEGGKIEIHNDEFHSNILKFFELLPQASILLSKNLFALFEDKFYFSTQANEESTELDSVKQESESKIPSNAVPSLPVETPSITSPLFTKLPPITNTSNQPLNPQSSTNQKFYDIKLTRYYKNLWLNNKIHNWTTDEVDFFPKYQGIEMTLDSRNSIPSLDDAVVDFVDTSFTCFAQFLNNKTYHQSHNSNFTLLEKKWVFFITKRMPLIIEKYCGVNKSHLVVKSLQHLDDKIVKVFRTYYANSQTDFKSNDNDDLFDTFNSPSGPELDIRHDFLKNMCMMKLQPPSIINKFLSPEDVPVDIAMIPANDVVTIKNMQNNLEEVHDLKTYVKSSLSGFDFESFFVQDTMVCDKSDVHGLIYLLKNFENVAPNSQFIVAETLLEMVVTSVEQFNYKLLAKICSLLTLNLGHSTSYIFTLIKPSKFVLPMIKFIDKSWDANSDRVFHNGTGNQNDTDVELFNDYIYFNFVLVFLLYLQDEFDVDLVAIHIKSSKLSKLENSFLLQYLQNHKYSSKELKLPVTKEPYKAAKLLQDWTDSLFVENSISDDLIKTSNIKDLAYLIPFIFDQGIKVLQSLVATAKQSPDEKSVDPSVLVHFNKSVVDSFEYFSQPFMMVGLIKIVFTLNSTIQEMKNMGIMENKMLFDIFLNVLTPLFNESGLLSCESKVLQNFLYRITGPKLLITLRSFKESKNINDYANSKQSMKLQYLISKLEKVCQGANLYNVNPELFETSSPEEQLFDNPDLSPRSLSSQRNSVFVDFQITPECPINKIMNKQSKSFWNLHSSTFFNYDYLLTVIRLISPETFFQDTQRTLTSKVENYGIPTVGNSFKKSENSKDDMDIVLDYLLYFTILFDFDDNNDKLQILQFLEFPLDIESLESPPTNKESTDGSAVKQELTENQTSDAQAANDDDFNMLFGEDSTDNIDDVLMDDKTVGVAEDVVKNSPADKVTKLSFLTRNTFAKTFHRHNESKNYPFAEFPVFYEKYLQLLKRSII